MQRAQKPRLSCQRNHSLIILMYHKLWDLSLVLLGTKLHVSIDSNRSRFDQFFLISIKLDLA
jgi:hypothetical protein